MTQIATEQGYKDYVKSVSGKSIYDFYGDLKNKYFVGTTGTTEVTVNDTACFINNPSSDYIIAADVVLAFENSPYHIPEELETGKNRVDLKIAYTNGEVQTVTAYAKGFDYAEMFNFKLYQTQTKPMHMYSRFSLNQAAGNIAGISVDLVNIYTGFSKSMWLNVKIVACNHSETLPVSSSNLLGDCCYREKTGSAWTPYYIMDEIVKVKYTDAQGAEIMLDETMKAEDLMLNLRNYAKRAEDNFCDIWLNGKKTFISRAQNVKIAKPNGSFVPLFGSGAPQFKLINVLSDKELYFISQIYENVTVNTATGMMDETVSGTNAKTVAAVKIHTKLIKDGVEHNSYKIYDEKERLLREEDYEGIKIDYGYVENGDKTVVTETVTGSCGGLPTYTDVRKTEYSGDFYSVEESSGGWTGKVTSKVKINKLTGNPEAFTTPMDYENVYSEEFAEKYLYKNNKTQLEEISKKLDGSQTAANYFDYYSDGNLYKVIDGDHYSYTYGNLNEVKAINRNDTPLFAREIKMFADNDRIEDKYVKSSAVVNNSQVITDSYNIERTYDRYGRLVTVSEYEAGLPNTVKKAVYIYSDKSETELRTQTDADFEASSQSRLKK